MSFAHIRADLTERQGSCMQTDVEAEKHQNEQSKRFKRNYTYDSNFLFIQNLIVFRKTYHLKCGSLSYSNFSLPGMSKTSVVLPLLTFCVSLYVISLPR